MKSVVAFFFLLVLGLAKAYPQFKTDTVPYGDSGASQIFTHGNSNKNLEGRIYALPGPTEYGVGTTYNNNGHSLSFDHVRNPGLGTSNTIKGTGQIYNDGNNKVTGTVFGTRHRYPRQANGHDVFGGSIDYSNQRGDAGKITYSNTPIIDRQQVGVQGKYNIHKTPDSAVSVYGGATKDIGRYQPRNSRPDYNVGIEYSRKF